MNRLVSTLVVLFVLVFSTVAYSVPLGVVSFDNFIPGVNAFNLNNFTGASSLPPDFPVTDSLMFDNSNLAITFADGSTLSFSLGDIGPGALLDSSGNPLFSLQFPDTDNFISASFTATLNLMHFAVQRDFLPDDTAAQTQAQTLVNLSDSNAVVGMSFDEKSEVLNFNIP